jgi:hypothetical protein
MDENDDPMADLRGPLAELGRRWASSSSRPKPLPSSLARWDEVLERWVASNLPLLYRTGKTKLWGTQTHGASGRKIFFADNTPAWWSFGLALGGDAPDVSRWTDVDVSANVPLGMMRLGSFRRAGRFRRDVNQEGWKVCHIDGVSDRSRRTPVEALDDGILRSRFRRFLSPRNMFLVPKDHAGMGELPEVIAAVRLQDCELGEQAQRLT